MANAVNIVLADAQATPVNHTFIPLGKDSNDVFWFEDQSQANSLGYWKLSVQFKRVLPGAPGQAAKSDRINRVILALHEPTLETLGTADNGLTPPFTIAYITRSKTEFLLPERGTTQNRKDIRKMAQGMLGDAQIIALTENLIPIF